MRTITWGDLTWIDIDQPTREVAKYLEDRFKFHPLDMEDSLNPRHQLPKIEEYPGYLFVIFHLSVFDKVTRVSTRKQWSAFVGENLLVTLRPPELKVADELFRECEASEDARSQYFSKGSGYLLYQILDRAIDRYFKVLDKISALIEDIEDHVFQEEHESAMTVSMLRRDIINQKRVMFPTRSLIIELDKKLKRFTKTDLTLYFSDLLDHLNKIIDTLGEYTEVIDVFKDADYLLSGSRTNRTIRALAALFAIVMPILIVAAIYVMLPSDINKGSPGIFYALIGGIAALIAILLIIFRRNRWI